jgi:hypothetical protein
VIKDLNRLGLSLNSSKSASRGVARREDPGYLLTILTVRFKNTILHKERNKDLGFKIQKEFLNLLLSH